MAGLNQVHWPGGYFSENDLANISCNVEYFSESFVGFDPKVSVVLMTRNHSEFFSEAFESITSQYCPFDIEVIVAEDASTDGTLDVVRDCAMESSIPVILVSGEHRVGILENFLRAAHRARGEYIALLEGDDYWCDSSKLAAQVEVLEGDGSIGWVGALTHNRDLEYSPKGFVDDDEILSSFLVHTSTMVFRRTALFPCPKFPNAPGWISYLTVLFQSRGKCYLIPEHMSVYRHHVGGVWIGRSVAERMAFVGAFTEFMIDALDSELHVSLLRRELAILKADMGALPASGLTSRVRELVLVLRPARRRWQRIGRRAALICEFQVWVALVKSEVTLARIRMGLGSRIRRVLGVSE